MIIDLGNKKIFRFINTGFDYEVFEKKDFGWEFVGIARDSYVLNKFIEAVKNEMFSGEVSEQGRC